MLEYPAIDPVAFRIGPLAVHWYGLMYLFGFAIAWMLGRIRASAAGSPLARAQVDDLLFYVAIGVLVGGRLGYVLFYDFAGLSEDPLRLLRIWDGGMSFHGGLLGVLVALLLLARRLQRSVLHVADFVAPLVPIALGLGRIGNFINAELWGRPVSADFPLSMVYEGVARHPSQLYQAALEGVVLFVIVWVFSARPRPAGAVSGVFLLAYGCFRILVEFVRLPDEHIGYLAFGWLTLGQVLSLPMLAVGAWLLWRAYRRVPEPR